MKLVTRRPGSQRTSKEKTIEAEQNFAGQGGYDYIAFKDKEGKYYLIKPETEEDVKMLLRLAHVVHHNFKP